jgi:uncharacterized protein (TIGR02145 family)
MSLFIFKKKRINCILFAIYLFAFTSLLYGQNTTNTMTGNDGKVYQTVKIGNQWWMAENLKETKFRDGSAIPNVTGKSSWVNRSTGAWCFYNNDESNADTYGYLYNWYAVTDSRNIAPAGWHVPSDADWKVLTDHLGKDAGSKLAGGYDLWEDDNLRTNASFNESGFSTLPAGCRWGRSGTFSKLGN